MELHAYGWDADVADAYRAHPDRHDLEPGRVCIEFNYLYRVQTATGGVDAVLAGRLKHRASSRAELPAVGDWVVVRRRPGEDRAAIVAVLPRRSAFSRRMAGQVTDEQVVAANVDVIFIVMGLDADFSLRRLERYLLLVREGGASPVVLLTKPDLCPDADRLAGEAAAAAGGAPTLVLNPRRSEGLEQVSPFLAPGRTAALLGSSGVGKSTIINRLAGRDIRKTREVRLADSKGRHTTTHRELIVLPGGGIVIDTPGMRELQLWDVGEAVTETFDEIETLAADCRFADCRHREEPGCAVKAAVADGRVDAARLASYLKLQAELDRLTRQQDERAERVARRLEKTAADGARRRAGTGPPRRRR